jgi:peptidyl-prolyl cis-trans isomerase SurA
MKKNSLIIFCFLMIASGIWMPLQASSGSIAAIVNDRPISKADLEARINMAILSAGLEKNRQTHDYLAPQVLKVMIDEELQIQRTERFKINPSESEITHAIQTIEQRNGMQKGQLKEMFQKHNIPFRTIERHVRASIAWRDYIRDRYEPLVQVTDEEINRYLAELESSKKEDQVMLAEIFLSVDSADSEETVRQNAREMVKKIRQGAHFSALAQEFSSAPSAARGGDIGWIAPSRLEKPLQEAILHTPVGEITEPVQTKSGYYILFVRDRRAAGENIGKDTLLTFNQMVLALPRNASQEKIYQAVMRVKSIGDHAKSCDMMMTLTKNDPAIQIQRVNKASFREMPAELRNVLGPLALHHASKPILSEMGVMMFMVCEKENINPHDPTTEEVRGLLVERKLLALAEREMRSIRRAAHITIQP